jgi:hypothetical protein
MSAGIATLKQIRPPPGNPTTLPMDRAILYAAALLRFHFNYGDFVRWLGGEYTNRHRNWDDTFDTLLAARQRHPPNDFPPADYPTGKRVFPEGVPLKGHFVSPSAELPARNRYDNHSTTNPVAIVKTLCIDKHGKQIGKPVHFKFKFKLND